MKLIFALCVMIDARRHASPVALDESPSGSGLRLTLNIASFFWKGLILCVVIDDNGRMIWPDISSDDMVVPRVVRDEAFVFEPDTRTRNTTPRQFV